MPANCLSEDEKWLVWLEFRLKELNIATTDTIDVHRFLDILTIGEVGIIRGSMQFLKKKVPEFLIIGALYPSPATPMSCAANQARRWTRWGTGEGLDPPPTPPLPTLETSGSAKREK